MKKLFLIIALIFILGCAQAKDFDYGASQINSLNSKYNVTMETYPKTWQQINLMIDDLKELKKLQLETGQEPFEYIVDYRSLNLEAEKLYIESQKYGNTGTTKDGFGCKSRPLIIESVSLRNKSALKGFEAAGLLNEFVAKYPEESKSAGLSFKNVLFLNASFYEISKDARSDSNVINHFCPKNVTLELYQQELRKKTNLSEDFINKLSYEEAVPIWKKVRGVS
ncbi:hypothetical protein HYX04_04600 [Candidatus Woesearchaeota archaeon]|nr:hypothetical protein [Candidatus Woesearchaeota archaeon]